MPLLGLAVAGSLDCNNATVTVSSVTVSMQWLAHLTAIMPLLGLAVAGSLDCNNATVRVSSGWLS